MFRRLHSCTAVTNSQRVYRYNNQRSCSVTPETCKPFKSIPGLSSLPYLGPIHHFLPVVGTIGPQANFFELIKILHQRFGSIVKLDGIFARANMVILYEPEHFDQIYRAEDTNPSRPGFDTTVYYRTVMRKDTYDGVYGLTTAQGAQWRDFRTKVNPPLLKLKLVKLYAPALEEIAKEMVARLSRLKNDERYLQNNFELEMTKWSLESVSLIALGTRLGCLRDDIDEEHPARQLMKCAKDIFDLSYKVEFTRSLWQYISTPNFKKLVKAYDTQWDVSVKYIEEAKKKINERDHDIPEEDKSVIEKLLAIDERVAVMMANEMLFAGIDTVSFAATALLYDLATNPEKQAILREEIRSNGSSRYLKACLKESLRRYPVIAANLRRATQDHIVAGYHIPKGTDVIAPNEYLSLSEKYYPQANKFIPERWLVDKSDPLYYGNAHPMITLPFGFGTRSCIGRRIAEMEIESLMKELLRDMKVTWNGPPIAVVTRIMNSFKKPYHFKFESV